MIRLVPAKPSHIGPIANRMRAQDIEECAAFGRSPKQALRMGLRASIEAYTALVDGRPEAMMGLTPVNALERQGTPWMLGTEVIYQHPRAMLYLGPKVIARWRDSTRNLSNLVAVRNARAIRMLRRWGFEVGGEPTVVGGLEFVTFAMRD
jgi:hypothetical protein